MSFEDLFFEVSNQLAMLWEQVSSFILITIILLGLAAIVSLWLEWNMRKTSKFYQYLRSIELEE